jgi:sulfite exporter TauE/SafE
MLWAVMIPAFMLGLVSSAHCIGMCGPLALALPVQQFKARGAKITAVLLYNLGRISAYLLLGLLFGWLGRNLLVPGLQRWVAIAGGGLLVVISLLSVARRQAYRLPWVQVLFRPVYRLLNYGLQCRRLPGMYLLGLANGLLPCGLVYMAATAAFMWGTAAQGLLFMAFYGLGTVPAMALLSFMGYMISMPVRRYIRQLAPCISLLMGVLLLLRGLDGHLPFVSSMPVPGVQNGPVLCAPLK